KMMPNGQSTNVPHNNLDLETKEKLASYVLDYLRTLGCTRAAEAFQSEIINTDIRKIPEVDTPNILLGWFSIFYELYCAAPDRRHMYDISADAKAFHDFGFIQNTQIPSGSVMGPPFQQPPVQFPTPVPQVPMISGCNQAYYHHTSTENGNNLPINNVNQRMGVSNMMNQVSTHQQFSTPQSQQLQSTNQQLRSLINERSQTTNINNGIQENRMGTMNYQQNPGQHQFMDNNMLPPNGMQQHILMGNEQPQMNVDPRYMNVNQGYNQPGYQMGGNPSNINIPPQTQQQKGIENNQNMNTIQQNMITHTQL
uniref:LisH domain-containing protein n=2 Tax=Strongyloides stercoralis TaxID=6248 RepID=A0AAF5DMW0_STRER